MQVIKVGSAAKLNVTSYKSQDYAVGMEWANVGCRGRYLLLMQNSIAFPYLFGGGYIDVHDNEGMV